MVQIPHDFTGEFGGGNGDVTAKTIVKQQKSAGDHSSFLYQPAEESICKMRCGYISSCVWGDGIG